MSDVNYLSELFYSQEVWGYIGPLAFVSLGYFVAKKNKFLGLLWYLVCLVIGFSYLGLTDTTPNFIWNAIIIIFGGGAACIIPVLDD